MITTTREQRRQLERENAKLPPIMTTVPRDTWPANADLRLVAVWRSRGFLAQAFAEPDGITRLSINRTTLNVATGRWIDEIAWDDLQRIKRECGFGQQDAVEVYPADSDVVNVANMRHLWIMPAELPFKWKKTRRAPWNSPNGSHLLSPISSGGLPSPRYSVMLPGSDVARSGKSRAKTLST